MTSDFTSATKRHMAALEGWMAPIFAKAPHLSASAHQTLAQVAPWLALIFGILGVLGFFTAGMFSSILFMFTFSRFGFVDITMFIGILAGLIASVLELLAYSPLTRREKKGWNYLFYGTALSAAVAILNILIGFGYDMGGQLVGSLIGFWLLFEIRSLFH